MKIYNPTGFSTNLTGSFSGSVKGTLIATGNIIPSVSGAYDIGSTAFPFRDLYITQNSLKFIDDSTGNEIGRISVNSNTGDIKLLNTKNLSQEQKDNLTAENVGAEALSPVSASSLWVSQSISPGHTNTSIGHTNQKFHTVHTQFISASSTNVSGDLKVGGTVTAQQFHTEFVSASIIYESGSTKFGNSADDVHSFTGSISVLNGISGTLSTATQPNITSVGTLSSLAVSGNLTVDTNTLFVDAANNRVGIGTSSVTAPLTLSTSGSTLDGTFFSTFTIRNTGTSTFSRIRFDTGSTAKWGLTHHSDDTFRISNLDFDGAGTADDTAITILKNSNVGIGTNSPDSKLHLFTNGTTSTVLRIEDTQGQAGLRLMAGDASVNRATRIDFLDKKSSTTLPKWTFINDYNQNGTNDFRIVKEDLVSPVLTLLQSGNVGIGTTAPGHVLHTYGTSSWTTKIQGGNNLGAFIGHEDGYGMAIRTTRTASPYYLLNLISGGSSADVGGGTVFYVGADGYVVISGRMHINGSQSAGENMLLLRKQSFGTSEGATIADAAISFKADQNNYGSLIGYSYSNNAFYGGNIELAYHSSVRYSSLNRNAFHAIFEDPWSGNTQANGNPCFRIYGNGATQNLPNSYGGVSDQRLKTDITPSSSQWDDIKAINVVNYKLIKDIEVYSEINEQPPKYLGVIAQQLEQAGMTGLVHEDENGIKGVKYSILYMKAIKALQEAIIRIEDLESRISQLEG